MAIAAQAAAPAAPERLSYQGLLRDAAGAPRTGSVDLTLRLFDAATGGTLVYVQTYAAVPLADGVFTVELGPAGDAADGAAVPLTADLGDAFTADLGAGPERYLELAVGAEGPLARTPILSAAFALRADQAASAADTDAVGGVPSLYLTELYAHTSSDGQAVYRHSLAGLVLARDTDGDGGFTGPGESTSLVSGGSTPCAVAAGPGASVAVFYSESGRARLKVDRNDDLDFADPDEDVDLGVVRSSTAALDVAHAEGGRILVATPEILPTPGTIRLDWTQP